MHSLAMCGDADDLDLAAHVCVSRMFVNARSVAFHRFDKWGNLPPCSIYVTAGCVTLFCHWQCGAQIRECRLLIRRPSKPLLILPEMTTDKRATRNATSLLLVVLN